MSEPRKKRGRTTLNPAADATAVREEEPPARRRRKPGVIKGENGVELFIGR